MSERAKNHSVVILGVIATVFTIFIQVVKIGEVKGSIDTVIKVHEGQIKEHSTQLKEHEHSISRIEGHLGMNAEVSKGRPRNVANSQPSTSGPYSTP